MKINVYGIAYTIKEGTTEELTIICKGDINDINLGLHVPLTNEIYLNKEMNHDNKRRTLIHELSHAILFVLGYGGEYNQENVVDIIAAHHDYIENILKKWDKG